MIRLIRARNTEVIPYIYPHLTEDLDTTKDMIAAEIERILVSYPKDTYLLVAFDDQDLLAAFVVAYAPPNVGYVYMFQAWADAKYPEVSKQAFAKVVQWTQLLGRNRIHGETRRTVEAAFRKWGFKVISKTVCYNILEKELDNGWSENRINVERESETGGRSDLEVSAGQDRTTSSELQRPAGGEPAPAVRHGVEATKPVQPELPDGTTDLSTDASIEREVSGEPGPGSNG